MLATLLSVPGFKTSVIALATLWASLGKKMKQATRWGKNDGLGENV